MAEPCIDDAAGEVAVSAADVAAADWASLTRGVLLMPVSSFSILGRNVDLTSLYPSDFAKHFLKTYNTHRVMQVCS